MKSRGIRLLFLFLLVLGACGEAEPPLARAKEGLRFEPTAIDYGDVFVESNVLRRVRLHNSGGVSLSLRAATVPAAFDVSPMHIGLEAGEEKEVQIRFRPLRAGQVRGSIAFRSQSGEEWLLPVEGHALPIVLSLPDHIDFGDVSVGDSRSLDVSIESLSDAPLELYIQRLGASAFRIESTRRELPARSSLRLPVEFHPVVAGESAGWLQVQPCFDCAAQLVALQGVGLAPRLHPLPDRIDFGQVPPGTTGSAVLLVENRGNQEVEIGSLHLETEATELFSIEGPPLPSSLQPGSSLQWKLNFSPQRDGEVTARIHFVDLSGASLLEIPVLATAAGPHLHAGPLDFGPTPVGVATTRKLRLERRGQAGTIVIEDLRFVGADAADFRIEGVSLPLAVEEDLELDVLFEAREEGEARASLRIRTSYVGQPELEVPLSALAVESNCEIETKVDAIHFGLVAADQRHQRRIELRHVGSDACLLLEVGLEQASDDFRLVGAPSAPYLLGPGEQLHFFVELLPVFGGNGWSEGKVTWSWRPDEAPREIPLSAYRADPMPLEVEPDIRFIPTPVGRISFSDLRMSTYSPLPSPVSVRLVPEGSEAFVFADWSGTIGLHRELAIRFSPERAGPHRATIEILVPGYPESIRVELRGEAPEECEAPCPWPVLACAGPATMFVGEQARLTSGLNGVTTPDHVSCHWQSKERRLASIAPQGAYCDATFLPWEAAIYELSLLVRVGSMAAECGLTIEVELPPEEEDLPDEDSPP